MVENKVDIINIQGVDCYERDGVAYLRLENCARGLGFTQVKNGVEYIRWETVSGYLENFGFPNKLGKDSFIPENIFYRLAMKAKNETAEKFQALVADEIIPSIRKTGGYIAGQETMTDAELMAKAVLVAQRTIAEREKRIASLEAKAAIDAPKVLLAESIQASEDTILIGELAKILKQNGVDTGEKRLFAWLRANGYLIRRVGRDHNMPTQFAMERGLFRIKECTTTDPDGSNRIRKTTTVTAAGQQYFVNLFLANVQMVLPCAATA